MFMIASRENGAVEPFAYYPPNGTLSLGMAVVLSAGKLSKATGTTKPTHITMGGVNSSGMVPCVRALPTTIFEALENTAVPLSIVGSSVTISSDALGVTGTTGGPFKVLSTDGRSGGVCTGVFE